MAGEPILVLVFLVAVRFWTLKRPFVTVCCIHMVGEHVLALEGLTAARFHTLEGSFGTVSLHVVGQFQPANEPALRALSLPQGIV
jgi:hypothetical protein